VQKELTFNLTWKQQVFIAPKIAVKQQEIQQTSAAGTFNSKCKSGSPN
jgi:hypothetical protein